MSPHPQGAANELPGGRHLFVSLRTRFGLRSSLVEAGAVEVRLSVVPPQR